MKYSGIILLVLLVVFTFWLQKKLPVYETETQYEQVYKLDKPKPVVLKQPKVEQLAPLERYTPYEKSLMKKGFLDIQQLDDDFYVNLSYATTDNFTGKQLYTRINHAFVHPRMAEKLVKAKQYLQAVNPNYTLLIYDALRPNTVQYKMWNAVEGTEKQKYVAQPSTGSIHNYGLSVDVTIFDKVKSQELPMGTPVDYLGREAEYRYNALLVQENKITPQERKNREFLREIMVKAGFLPINSEWWHFNTYNAQTTRSNYQIIK